MKTLLRSFLINVLALWAVSQAASGIVFVKGQETLVMAALVLGLFNLFVRPLINILLLPINLITLGTLRWVVNSATLYLVTLLVPGFKILGFQFAGITFQGIIIPALSFGPIGGIIAFSLGISLISGFLFWLVK